MNFLKSAGLRGFLLSTQTNDGNRYTISIMDFTLDRARLMRVRVSLNCESSSVTNYV